MQPHRRQPTRLRCPWDSPGKNTGVGCHFLLQCMKERVKSLQCMKVKSLSCVRLLATPWTAAHQAPLSIDFPGKSTGAGCHCLLPHSPKVYSLHLCLFCCLDCRIVITLSKFHIHALIYYIGREGNGTPLQYSCLENLWTEEPGGLQSMGSLRVGHN